MHYLQHFSLSSFFPYSSFHLPHPHFLFLSFPSIALSSWLFHKSLQSLPVLLNFCSPWIVILSTEAIFLFLSPIYPKKIKSTSHLTIPSCTYNWPSFFPHFFIFFLAVSISDFCPVFYSRHLLLDTPSHCLFWDWVLLCIPGLSVFPAYWLLPPWC